MNATMNIFLLSLLAALVQANASSVYNVVPRSVEVRVLQEPSESPLISFDGDLEKIAALAAMKASDDLRETYACDDEETEHLEIINWKYSIETVPGSNIEKVYGEVQEITLKTVAPMLLSCQSESVAYANIVAMDTAIPGDQQSQDTCTPELNDAYTCSVVIGRMRLFLSDQDSVENATALAIDAIQAAYEEELFDYNVGSGLMKVTFLPDTSAVSNPDGAVGENTDKELDETAGDDSDQKLRAMTVSSILYLSISSAALVAFVGSVYLWRRKKNGEEIIEIEEGQVSNFTNSMDQSGSNVDEERATSPYSEMVSGSYRLSENMSILSNSQGMSPVYEGDTDNESASVVVSEGGYTTEAGNTEAGDSCSLSKQSSVAGTPQCLGARPLPGTLVGISSMEEVSDSDLDTSGEMSPVKMFVGNNLLLPDGDQCDESMNADENLLFSPRPSDTSGDIETVTTPGAFTESDAFTTDNEKSYTDNEETP